MDQNTTRSKKEVSSGIKISVVEVSNTTPVATVRSKNDSLNLEKKNGCHPLSLACIYRGNDSPPYMTMFVAEVLGTGFLMFLGCMGCISSYDEPEQSHHFCGITFGLTVMLIIQTLGHISGAHLNPAVTIATVIFGILKPVMGLVYVIAQFIGATLGYGLLKILVPEKYAGDGFCVTTLNENISVIQGLGIETVITTLLILICCAVWDKRNAEKADSLPLRFGLAIAAISMAAGPLTGASMNTARSFAPLVFGGSWQHHWIYWVGPNVAPLIGCGIYKFVFTESEKSGSKLGSIYLDEVTQHSSEKI
jgi:aquaporin related protein